MKKLEAIPPLRPLVHYVLYTSACVRCGLLVLYVLHDWAPMHSIGLSLLHRVWSLDSSQDTLPIEIDPTGPGAGIS